MRITETWARKQREAVGCSRLQERNPNLGFDEFRCLSFSFFSRCFICLPANWNYNKDFVFELRLIVFKTVNCIIKNLP